MDGLLKNKITPPPPPPKKKKRGKILFTYGVQCINKPTSKRYLHAAYVNYRHDCWLGVTIKDIPAAKEKL